MWIFINTFLLLINLYFGLTENTPISDFNTFVAGLLLAVVIDDIKRM